jgi:limonene-1,2-epoxide hydrolase
MKTQNKVLLDFINAINSANVDRIAQLSTDDHQFVNPQGNSITGKENIKQAWRAYFELFPDYKIEVNEILENDKLVCMLGYAGATYKNLHNAENSNYWRIPAAWAAIVKDNRIEHWQVYADNIIVLDIINRNKEKE